MKELLAANACVKFHNAERGYIRCTVTPRDWKADYLVVDDVQKPGDKTFVRSSFAVWAGDPAVQIV